MLAGAKKKKIIITISIIIIIIIVITDLAKTHHFVPIAVDTGGAWNELALEFITKLGRRIARITQEPRETQFQFQRLSISLQRGNAVACRNTFSSER